jgi:hypothetical protein
VSGDGKKIRYYHPRINPLQIRPDIEKYLTKEDPSDMSREQTEMIMHDLSDGDEELKME